jgi:hypothetical protein
MNEKQVLEFCKTHNITVKQYFIVYATSRRWKGFPKEAQQLIRSEPWSEEEILDLVKKGLLTTSDGTYHPMSLCVNSDFAVNNVEMGEELWDNYPPTLPFNGGGTFVARTTKGQSKDTILKTYLTKIGNNNDEHKFVMEQLARYVKLVRAGRINGHTIVQFIEDEVWRTIAEIQPEEVVNKFRQSI